MKKYTEYLEELYQPLTADEIKKVSMVIQNPIEQKLYDEVIYLRRLICLLYTSPSPRDRTRSRMPSSA